MQCRQCALAVVVDGWLAGRQTDSAAAAAAAGSGGASVAAALTVLAAVSVVVAHTARGGE